MSKEEDDRLRRILNSEEETQGVYNPAPVEPPSQITDKYYRPALDEDNMPLPRRVDEIDLEGTRVTPNDTFLGGLERMFGTTVAELR